MFRKFYESGEDSGMQNQSKKIKRYRSAFTTGQVNYLEKQFKKCPYIGSASRKEVANVLNIPERAIKIWFQNRRMKEKKEVINKEHAFDRQNSMHNVEFAKASLNNVHSSQSTNDRQCSLQSTVSNQADKINSVTFNDAVYSKFSNQNKKEMLTRRAVNCDRSPIFNDTEKLNYMTQTIDQIITSKPANIAEYHINNMYNDGKFVKCLEKSKKGEIKRKVLPKLSTKSLPHDSLIQKVPSVIPGCQDSPEDLSASKLPNVMMPRHHYGNINLNSAYVPFCNTENVCLSAGNVIWKPVNVMSVVSPNGLPITIPEMQPHEMIQNNTNKCKCNCNCSIKNRMNYQRGVITPQPQYVIAIPYGNNSNIL